MRNLQKILALALALIMSFSLVVTANAAFSDEADINETYNESVNVLAQLEVFRGYTDGSYKPQDSITRAEVAAIIYRIATGDVSDSQVSLYSDWNRFKDVASGSWYAGYVNYCANAEYIKGYEDGSFRPNNNVTGYEALAMILRAVGYGKMDEFVGSNWAVNTAARANTLKISKNVTAALLGSPASREVVAELLFRSILVPTVTYNNAFGYQETDTTLGYDSFKLEQIEGVVVANEYANLYDTQVLGAGKTDFEIAKDDVRSLNIASELTAVGESHYAYVSGSTVYALENTGDNTVWEPENGKGTTITGSKFLSNTGLKKDDSTEFYFNFGREGHFSCDQRLEFTVVFYHPEAEASFDKAYEDVSKYAYAHKGDWTVKTGVKGDDGKYTWKDAEGDYSENGSSAVSYNRVIRAEEEITAQELEILRGIFAAADNDLNNGKDRDQITGDVYVGTKSTSDKVTDEERDLSNSISYRKFVDEYINSEAWDQDIESSKNGQWLKVVDNDGDGIAEYAFLTQYYLDEAVGSYTKSGEAILEFNSLDIEDRKDDGAVIDIAEGIAVGDVVLYTDIDNRVTMTKAESVKAKIKTVNFKDETCTTTDDVTYNQSGIANETDMDELVVNMDDQVDYNIYFDKYGYARAYELANGNQYGLLTELYWSRGQNGQYVTNAELTVEMKAGKTSIDEYTVSNKDNEYLLRNGNDKNQDWADLDNGKKTVYDVAKKSEIVLQPAIGQLGLENAIIHDREFEDIFTDATTNVGVYVETGEGEVRLTSPVKYAANTKGERLYYNNAACTGGKDVHTSTNGYDYPAYEIDFVELDADASIAADARRYSIDEGSRYAASRYVNAVHDTEYYVLDKGNRKADYFTDYDNVYAIDSSKIIAAYAVARNTEYDSDGDDYWVADVIVIEVSELDTTYDSTSILYTNPSQTSGSTKSMWGLNTEYGDTEMIPENKNWDSRWDGNWAYEVDEKELKDGVLYANGVTPINENYNARGLYAGIVDRVKDINKRGAYIDVRWPIVGSGTRSAGYEDYGVYSVDLRDGAELLAIGSSSGKNYETRTLFASDSDTRNDFHTGDRVMWGVNKDGEVTFVLNIDYVKGSWAAPEWLTEENADGLWWSVAEEQTERHNAPSYSDAVDAYTAWVKDQGNADKKAAAKEALEGAIDSGKLTSEEVADLKKMLATLTGATTPSGEVSGVPVGKDETAGINVLGITKEPDNTDKNNGTLDLYVRDKDLTTIQMLQNALRSSVSGENLTVQGIQADGSVAPMNAYVDRMSSIKVIISKGDASKTYTATIKEDQNSYVILTLGEGVRAYSDEDHENELLTGAIKAERATTIYLVASGAGYFKVDADGSKQELKPTDNSAAYSSSKDETYSSITTSPGTSASSDVKVDFVKEAKVDGSAEFEIKAGVSATLEKKSDTEYVVYMKSDATLPTDDPAIGTESGPGTNIIAVKNETGLVAGSLAWLNFHKVSSSGSEAVYTYYARGIYGGENTTYTFTFIKASEAAPVATVTSVNGFNAADNATDGKKVTITDATVITADMVKVENGTLIGLFADEHGATPMEKVPVVDNSVFYAGILGTDKATITYVKVTINPNP